jgi:hypothetical protein
MIEINSHMVEALLSFKRKNDPFFGVISRSHKIHSIVTGDNTTVLWLILDEVPIDDGYQFNPLLLADLELVPSIKYKGIRPPVRVRLSETYDLVLSVTSMSEEFVIHAARNDKCPTLPGLLGMAESVANASGEPAEFHPDVISGIYRATKKLCWRHIPHIIQNGEDPALVLFDGCPELFGVVMPMRKRPYPDSVVGVLLGNTEMEDG